MPDSDLDKKARAAFDAAVRDAEVPMTEESLERLNAKSPSELEQMCPSEGEFTVVLPDGREVSSTEYMQMQATQDAKVSNRLKRALRKLSGRR